MSYGHHNATIGIFNAFIRNYIQDSMYTIEQPYRCLFKKNSKKLLFHFAYLAHTLQHSDLLTFFLWRPVDRDQLRVPTISQSRPRGLMSRRRTEPSNCCCPPHRLRIHTTSKVRLRIPRVLDLPHSATLFDNDDI